MGKVNRFLRNLLFHNEATSVLWYPEKHNRDIQLFMNIIPKWVLFQILLFQNSLSLARHKSYVTPPQIPRIWMWYLQTFHMVHSRITCVIWKTPNLHLWSALLLGVLEVPCSNLSHATDYADRSIHGFPELIHTNAIVNDNQKVVPICATKAYMEAR
jgi:hypothetical protein